MKLVWALLIPALLVFWAGAGLGRWAAGTQGCRALGWDGAVIPLACYRDNGDYRAMWALVEDAKGE